MPRQTFADFQNCRRSAFLRYHSWIRDVLTSSGWCSKQHLLPWHLLERQGKKIREKLPQKQVTCAHLLRGIWVAMETTSPNSFPLPPPKQLRHKQDISDSGLKILMRDFGQVNWAKEEPLSASSSQGIYRKDKAALFLQKVPMLKMKCSSGCLFKKRRVNIWFKQSAAL